MEFIVKSLAEFLVKFLVWTFVESPEKSLLSSLFEMCIDVWMQAPSTAANLLTCLRMTTKRTKP